MLIRRRVTSQDDILFKYCWDLYVLSFPLVERRELDYHLETMLLDNYHFEVLLSNGEPIGVVGWWDLSNYRFIEHFATSPELRGRGYGEAILRQFIGESDDPILLEVEHPTEELSRRRIGFYQRIGFVLNEHNYSHPSYQQREGQCVELMVMTYPEAIDGAQLQSFMDNQLPIIHFRSY